MKKKKKKPAPVLSAQEQWNAKIKVFFPEAEAYAKSRCKMGKIPSTGPDAAKYTHDFCWKMNELTIAAGLRVK